jgi:hypothetical protein
MVQERVRAELNSKVFKRERPQAWEEQPGRLVGVIAVRAKGYKGAYNPLKINFVVNRTRKDYNRVVAQSERPKQLPKYSSSLFHSMFKKW